MKLFTTIALMCLMLATPQKLYAQNWWDSAKKVFNTTNNTAKPSDNPAPTGGQLTDLEIQDGLREALRLGVKKVVNQLGTEDGFNLNPDVHIPLPNSLNRVSSALSAVGMGELTEDLELRLNRAAEAATPKAKELFVKAISDMSIEDARGILSSSENAATQYLKRTMSDDLRLAMKPIVNETLASAGAFMAYDNVMAQYAQIPFMPNVKSNLSDYAVDKAMDGIFYYVGKEEAAIRANPVARTTDLLKKVFTKK